MDEAALETPQTWAIATDKRKAWAKSRDSWQASEAEDVSTEGNQIAQAIEGKLQLGGEPGNIPNEKIAIWLKDCRTPLGASLDEQSNPAGFLRGMLLKNGGSFEDDLSLGAEANHLHQSNLPIEPTCNGMLAKDRRLQYHQKGRSMNSTGSAKSSATVSSVSELLDLYEEDPEEILYNLGFGRDEPDIASKIPSRFFNSSSFARGIDIKVFLSAQMQRLEVENPNYALTSRFRQIEVLTTVANAFSSLYSQVSGTPLQRIGSSASLSTNKEPDKPAPLNRTTSQTASRLMKTLSKLNLYGTQPTGEGAISSPGTDNQGLTPKSNEDDANKTEKLQKPFKKNSPPLATVKEEASNSLLNVDTHSPVISLQLHEKLVDELAEACTLKQEESSSSQNECNTSSIIDLSPPKDIVSTDTESEINLEETSPHTSTPDKQLCTPLSNPSIKSLAFQTKDSSSFEMEEVQSTEEETSHIPSICQSVLEKLSKDNLLRTASQHSDSSGFAEDPSSDCPLNSLQVHEPLQTMGSSADSCDSETTVTSVCDDLKTPLATDPPESIDFEIDEFLTPIDLNESKVFFGTNQEISKENIILENQMVTYEDCKTQEELNSGAEINQDNSEEELQHQCTVESELETGSEYDLVPYMTHHISESVDCFSDYDDGFHQLGKAETGSLERVNVALQRAQMKIISSETSGSKRGRSLVKSKDLLKRRHKLSDSGYPLRRTQSLPSEMLSPVRVVSKVNIVLSSGKATVCSPPTFSYKYSPEEQECMEPLDEEANTNYKSTLPISKKSEYKENSKICLNRLTDDTNPVGSQSSSMQATSQRSHSSCSLHSLQSDWHERPLCEYARTWSTHSVPCFSGTSCGALFSPYACPLAQRVSCGSLNRSYSGYSLPAMSAPSTTEMQLRRVLHDIRNSLQNLSQHPLMRGSDGTTSGYSNQRPSVLPLYENTFQELQIMKRSLNLFRTQMMDLELNMLRQQTMVYQHLTDEERYEADQLQGLRNSVRMELQELELQLDERLMTLEEQLRNFHMSSPFHRSSNMGMYGSRSTDSLVFSSPLNVIEPVTELIREQTHLKTELGLGDLHMETEAEACESVSSRAASDTSSVCSGSPLKSRKGVTRSSDVTDILKPQTPPCKTVFRASVALTPSPPTRPGELEKSEVPENCAKLKMEPAEKAVPLALKSNESIRRTEEENRELQQVIREIKESIVGDIRREIVSGLLAAVSSPIRSLDGKTDGRI